MNAKIDNNKCVGNSYHNYTNRNGELGLTIDCGLVNISTKFQKINENYGLSLIQTEPEVNLTISLLKENGKIVLLAVDRSAHTHL